MFFAHSTPRADQSDWQALPDHLQSVGEWAGQFARVFGAQALGIVIGRDSEGRRFIANTPTDEATLRGLEASEAVGRTGTVGRSEDGARNIFVPD